MRMIPFAFVAALPMAIGVIGSLVNPGQLSRNALRYRCFRSCGAGRLRALALAGRVVQRQGTLGGRSSRR